MAAATPFAHAEQARLALRAIVADHGPEVLSRPRELSNLLADLLPDAPRISKILVAAAQDRVAEELRQHTSDGMDTTTASRLAASSFADATMFAPDVCTWVVGQFALALGLTSDAGALVANFIPPVTAGTAASPDRSTLPPPTEPAFRPGAAPGPAPRAAMAKPPGRPAHRPAHDPGRRDQHARAGVQRAAAAERKPDGQGGPVLGGPVPAGPAGAGEPAGGKLAGLVRQPDPASPGGDRLAGGGMIAGRAAPGGPGHGDPGQGAAKPAKTEPYDVEADFSEPIGQAAGNTPDAAVRSPKAVGRAPETAVPTLEAAGRVPEAASRAPEAAASAPEAASRAPEAAASVPEAAVPQTAVPAPVGAKLTWTAVVTADRAYFDGVVADGELDAASIEFPRDYPERRVRLSGTELRIGRRSASRGLEPEIDLTGPPTDPGISHLHAALIGQPDGTWAVIDRGSSNGTQVNGREIDSGVPVPLRNGDRVCLGAWTALTVHSS